MIFRRAAAWDRHRLSLSALLHALHALRGQLISKPELTREAIRIEQEGLKEVVGSQDQVLAAHGGFNLVQFQTSGDIAVRPVTVPPIRLQQLNDHLLLFYTGLARTSSEIAASYVSNLARARSASSISMARWSRRRLPFCRRNARSSISGACSTRLGS